ncbi:MAG: DUF560 domain-containing protein [Brachymonas sp.]|nr:DUF560 domain-containing protein [Brachymonas sp.]
MAASLLWVVHSSFAQDTLLQNAQSLLTAKQATQAYQLLSPQETARAGQPDFDYLLGIAALDSGRVTQAIFAFERVLAVQPGNALARAELARAYIAAGEADTAKSQLQQVKASPNVPPEARASVDRLLSSLESSSQGKPLKMYVEMGLGHDSNLSGGPNLTTFAVPNIFTPSSPPITVTLPAASRQRSDSVYHLGAGLTYQHALNASTDLTTQLNWRSTQPQSEKDLDTQTIDASIGIAHTAGANRYFLNLQHGQLSFDGNSYRKTTGISGQWLHSLSATQQLMAFVQHASLRYPGPGFSNAKRNVIGGAWGLALSSSTSMYLGAAFGGEQADKVAAKELGFKLTGLRAGGEHVLSQQMRLFANVGYEIRRHRANDFVFGLPRQDEQLDLALGLHYLLAPTRYGQWRITPQINFTHRDSNINVYEMKRTQINLTARLDF